MHAKRQARYRERQKRNLTLSVTVHKRKDRHAGNVRLRASGAPAAVLAAVNAGCSSRWEILNQTGLAPAAVDKALQRLTSAGAISKLARGKYGPVGKVDVVSDLVAGAEHGPARVSAPAAKPVDRPTVRPIRLPAGLKTDWRAVTRSLEMVAAGLLAAMSRWRPMPLHAAI
jgi:hypothetical protein